MNFLVNKIKSVKLTGQRLSVELLDGRSVGLPLSLFPTLAEAAPKARGQWELCGAGTGIHWPLLDYDLSAEGLLRGEPEAPGVRRAQKTQKHPPHLAGKQAVLAEAAGRSPAGRSPRSRSP